MKKFRILFILAILIVFSIHAKALITPTIQYQDKHYNYGFSNQGANNLKLRAYSVYKMTCKSEIADVNTGDRDNIKFFYTNGAAFDYNAPRVKTLKIRTYDKANSYFEVFNTDSTSTSFRFSISPSNPLESASGGECTILPR